jgi:hypothetical protein
MATCRQVDTQFTVTPFHSRYAMVHSHGGASPRCDSAPFPPEITLKQMLEMTLRLSDSRLARGMPGFRGPPANRVGDFASDKLHVVERYTRADHDHLNYEATLEDPSMFSRPWKISMPLDGNEQWPLGG